ncbi:molybdopterin molybdotransferase MoeA [Babesia caballi]|uniref:Molybdopterin molybdotransferase MoeA n=1 Tax=Babesia caballi TaxID=5871 RepID=A0AAV4M073_BABCB|nr:molybdopterin molybdotransferase MoeA [Babesia caballi]
MHALLKAKFCHTAHTVFSKGSAPAEGAGSAKLPDLSTKAQRLYDLLHPQNVSGEASVGAHHASDVTNIDIKNIDAGDPQIYLNGEEVKPEKPVKEQEELLKQQSGGSQPAAH